MTTATHEPTRKRELLGHLAGMARALGHEYRLELIELIAQDERSVESLVRVTGLPIGTVSQHLQQLRRAGLVRARREGKYVFYSLADDRVIDLLGSLRRLAEDNLAEVRELVEQYFRPDPDLEAIDSRELLERLRSDTITLLDVRPAEEFLAGHLPGALNIPLDELEQRLGELPRDREIVAYCRGPYCVLAVDAVRLLRRKGVTALRYEEGYPEWKQEGLPVDKDPTRR